MPGNKYLKVSIDRQELELPADGIGLSLNFKLEDLEDFQKKKSSESFDFAFPATPHNDKILNTFHNPGVEDTTADEIFSSHRPAVIEANGEELLVGKAFLTEATHDFRPLGYIVDFYGQNADWIIDLKETTLFDLLSHITFGFTKANIMASWAFDGNDENLPYVFAPVRYGLPMEKVDVGTAPNVVSTIDLNMIPVYMKPSLSKWWLIYWGFKLAGYRVDSVFMATEYFRRQVMPWTWGNFLDSDGTKNEIHRFLAIGTDKYFNISEGASIGHNDFDVSNDSSNGAFDNNSNVVGGDYTYNPSSGEMRWTYNAPDFGTIEANLSIQVSFDFDARARAAIFKLNAIWYVNGVQQQEDKLANYNSETQSGNVTSFFGATVVAGDYISCILYLSALRSKDTLPSHYKLRVKVMQISLDYFRIPIGGTIAFDGLYSLKKYKFLDFLKGVFDEFNIGVQTDSISKVVTMEPLHDYAIGADLSDTTPGYLNGNTLDWNDKQDLSQVSKMKLFSDNEREVAFSYKDDTNDGVLKVVQDREQHPLAAAKYVLPARFKTGKKEITNSFFSPVMHYDVTQWAAVTGVTPQMIVMCPENISNTSREEAQNTFAPKSAYYKGDIEGVGGWIFDGDNYTSFPFMFAVNYQPGGENDPVLSYSDERIGLAPDGVRAAGLLRRFYLQRMAIMRLGKNYETSFLLNNKDVTNWLHREHIVCRGQKWELVSINDYRPLEEKTTATELRKWTPITENDSLAIYPSADSVEDATISADAFDIKYTQLKCLSTDIPQLD